MKKARVFTSLLLAIAMLITMVPMNPINVFAEKANHVVISEAYGGGGNSNATYKNDFIELYNPTSTDIDISGWQVQYASATGSFGSNNVVFQNAVIKAGGYFLIQAAAGAGGTVDLPTPDATCNINMHATNFKLRLLDNNGNVVDFLGAGTANDFETKPASAASNTTSAQRKDNDGSEAGITNGWDTDNNSEDFYTAAPTPRNSQYQSAPSAVVGVEASPGNGSSIKLGTTITLSTPTEDAHIVYSLNGGEEVVTSSNTAQVVISEFDEENKATITAKAVKGEEESLPNTFVYHHAKTSAVTANPVGAVSDGDIINLSASENAVIKYIITYKVGTEDETISEEFTYTTPILVNEADLPMDITAFAIEEGYLDSDPVVFRYYLRSNEPYRNYYGQLHSHTAENSDGSGTLVEAYAYAKNVAKLDFFAVTDHSNSFDTAPSSDKYPTYNLVDYNSNNVKWQNGLRAAENARDENFISIYGYEMTWSGGPGHINTFNTTGFVSRNNTELNNKTNNLGLQQYYQLLKDTPNSISQFNHPGPTFGNFADFAYLDPVIDQRISLIEVGNGEGAVGSGGYFRSYDQYIKALDKGWHLAPTNNQDNHKGKWGDANTARTVIYTNDLSLDGLYAALREMRVWATEDNNLDIVYTLNDNLLGTILDEVPESATIKVSVNDPDPNDKIHTLSIISNGGKALVKETVGSNSIEFETTIEDPTPGYYFVQVVQEDGDIAVTAPIWLGSAPKLGIDSLFYDQMMPVTDESLKITTKLFNNESTPATLKSIEYQLKNGSVIYRDTPNQTIPASGGMINNEISHIFTTPGKYTVYVTAVIESNGEEMTFTKELDINVRDRDRLIYVGIDASHDNEYVAGNYKASMGNFAALAANYDIRVVELNTSEELISALNNPKYEMFIFTVPSRRNGSTGRIPWKSYSDAEIQAVENFAKQGKTLILTGWGDYYESYSNLKNNPAFTPDQHMAAQQNKILEAIGARLRITDDEAKDNVLNGGQPQRLYLTDHNGYVNPFTQGLDPSQVFSQYGGSTIHAVDENGLPTSVLPNTVLPIISGHETTFSADDDKDGNPLPPKYNDRLLLMASEEITYENGNTATVIAAGGAFMSNFEVQVEVDNAGTLPYSNYNIVENILVSLKDINPISEVHTLPIGTQVLVEGIVTTDVYNGSDDNKGFFDCIYIQDETGGINLFPVSSGVEVGQKVRVLGNIDEYQGERQILVQKITVIDSTINPVEPLVVSPQQAISSENLGRLVKFTGTVEDIKTDANGVVGQLIVDGVIVYINGYITKNVSLSHIKVGDRVEVTGISSIGENMSSDTEFLPRIRVRDRSEIVLLAPEIKIEFNDVKSDSWYANSVYYVTSRGLLLDSPSQAFRPNSPFTRAMLAQALSTIDSEDLSQYNKTNFNDVKIEHDYGRSVAWAVENNIMSGYANKRFAPNQTVTIDEMEEALNRYLGYKNIDLKDGRYVIELPNEAIKNKGKNEITRAIAAYILEDFIKTIR